MLYYDQTDDQYYLYVGGQWRKVEKFSAPLADENYLYIDGAVAVSSEGGL